MKKFLYLLLIVAFATSCSSDDEATTTFSQSDIVGRWKIIDYNDSQVGSLEEAEVAYDEPCFSLQEKEFFNNGVFDFYYRFGNNCQSQGSFEKNYTISGNVLTETEVGGGFDPNRDYIVKYYITEITQNTVKLQGFYVDEGHPASNDFVLENPIYEEWQRID